MIGSHYNSKATTFCVWAPYLDELSLKIVSPQESVVPLIKAEGGYWRATVEGLEAGALYVYHHPQFGDKPDPCSYSQPQGVHGPSAVVDLKAHSWQARNWRNPDLKDYISYELHVGTFTHEGTFASAIERLDHLQDLGVTAVEVMPIAQFPGTRNWGYDGTYLFAAQHSYGGLQGFQQFVDACHQRGLAVILDVVYNHFGPEGNYTSLYAPYFTGQHHTPWGDAINFDDRDSDGVRRFAIENVLFWLSEARVDALRLDAVHAIYDTGAKHILREMREAVHHWEEESGRRAYLIAESDLNDSRIIRPPEQGGHDLDAQWSDDFHHAVHAYFTGERGGYYRDFGSVEDLAKALRQHYVYDWKFSEFRRRHHGNSPLGVPPDRFVSCLQNHDQVGNRALGDRMSALVDFETLKLMAGLLFLNSHVPLLFMGEEYAEDHPFLYFVSHSDEALVQGVREGRKREFEYFQSHSEEYPDPQSEQTYERSKLDWGKLEREHHAAMFTFYQGLIAAHKQMSDLLFSLATEKDIAVEAEGPLLMTAYQREERGMCVLYNLSREPQNIRWSIGGKWLQCLDSNDSRWDGSGESQWNPQQENILQGTLAPRSFILHVKETMNE